MCHPIAPAISANLRPSIPAGLSLRELFGLASRPMVATGAVAAGVLLRPLPTTILTEVPRCSMN